MPLFSRGKAISDYLIYLLDKTAHYAYIVMYKDVFFMMYTVNKIERAVNGINDEIWSRAETAPVMTANWDIPECKNLPNTVARLLYSDVGLHIKMTSDERPLRATVTAQNGAVCEDSCMEFFISPNKDDKRYINFEINPMGTMYLSLRYDRFNYEYLPQTASDFGIVCQITPTEWSVAYTVPFSFIDEIFGKHSDVMCGNFYKCGEKTEHSHYATYFPVASEKPDFHLPQTFGEFQLKK